jgi:hypothetical protein
MADERRIDCYYLNDCCGSCWSEVLDENGLRIRDLQETDFEHHGRPYSIETCCEHTSPANADPVGFAARCLKAKRVADAQTRRLR